VPRNCRPKRASRVPPYSGSSAGRYIGMVGGAAACSIAISNAKSRGYPYDVLGDGWRFGNARAFPYISAFTGLCALPRGCSGRLCRVGELSGF